MNDESCMLLCEAIIDRAVKDLNSKNPYIRGNARAFLESDFCAFMLGCKLDLKEYTIVVKEAY